MKRTSVRKSFGATRRARERSRQEAAILEAAEREIGRRGFHGAGMTEIAREAEYAVGTLYNLFGSKEGLYERLLVVRAEEIARATRAALRGPGEPRERLEAVLAAKLDFFARHIEFVRIYASTSILATGTWGLPAGVVRLRERSIRAVARVFEEARAAGLLRAEAGAHELAIAFYAVTQAFVMRAIRGPGAFDPERVRASVARVFLDPVFGRAPEPRRPRRVAARAAAEA